MKDPVEIFALFVREGTVATAVFASWIAIVAAIIVFLG